MREDVRGAVRSAREDGFAVDVRVTWEARPAIREGPGEVAKVGDRVRVKVLSVDMARRRMALSIKALQASPAGVALPRPPRERESFNSPRRR
jgi:ribosomal protein S1